MDGGGAGVGEEQPSRLREEKVGISEEVVGDTVGGAGVVATSSLTLVLPPAVETDKVACPPAFSILWKTSIRRVSSSSILASESESMKSVGAQILMSFHFCVMHTWLNRKTTKLVAHTFYKKSDHKAFVYALMQASEQTSAQLEEDKKHLEFMNSIKK